MNSASGHLQTQEHGPRKLMKSQLPPQLIAEFLSEIRRLVLLLEEEGETFWRTRLVDAEAKVRAGDWQGFKDFLAGYGTSVSVWRSHLAPVATLFEDGVHLFLADAYASQ